MGDDALARGVIDSLGSDSTGSTLAHLLKRPEIQIEHLAPLLARLMPGFFASEEVSSFEFRGSRKNDVILSEPVGRVEGPLFSAETSSFAPPETRDSKLETGLPSTIHHPLSTSVRNELKSVETEIKYAGYLDQQTKSIERLKRSEQRTIPEWFDYTKVSGLSREMREKMMHVRPRTLGQASRIPGVTPAAVSLINVFIEIQARQQASLSAAHHTPGTSR
jgi:tRNA uridine 5-carboxymethylaminomethyl modification enzyme